MDEKTSPRRCWNVSGLTFSPCWATKRLLPIPMLPLLTMPSVWVLRWPKPSAAI